MTPVNTPRGTHRVQVAVVWLLVGVPLLAGALFLIGTVWAVAQAWLWVAAWHAARPAPTAAGEPAADRAALLLRLAGREQATADALRADGQEVDAADAEAAALLVRWVAATEAGRCPVGTDSTGHPTLAALAATADPAERARLCEELAAVVAHDPFVGPGAPVLTLVAAIYGKLAAHDTETARRITAGHGRTST